MLVLKCFLNKIVKFILTNFWVWHQCAGKLKVYPGYAFQNVDVTSTFRLLKDTLSSINVWQILKDTVDVDSRQRYSTFVTLTSRQRFVLKDSPSG